METDRSWLRSWGFGSGKKSFDSIPNLLRLTLRLRRSTRERLTLDREHRSIDTALRECSGQGREKGDRIVNMWPEYEDLKALSLEKGVPLKILRLAVAQQLKLYD